MSEIVTPTTTFTLDTITVECGRRRSDPQRRSQPTPLYPRNAHGHAKSGQPFERLLLRRHRFVGWRGWAPIFCRWPPIGKTVNFTLDNTGTSDQVTLSPAVLTPLNSGIKRKRTPPGTPTPRSPGCEVRCADPGGQLFTKPNTNDFSTSRKHWPRTGRLAARPASLRSRSMEQRWHPGSPATTTTTASSTRPTTLLGETTWGKLLCTLPNRDSLIAAQSAPPITFSWKIHFGDHAGRGVRGVRRCLSRRLFSCCLSGASLLSSLYDATSEGVIK